MDNLGLKIRASIFLALLALGLVTKAQQEPIQVGKGYQVEIQTSAICDVCQHTIEYELTFTKGIKDAVLNLDNSVVTVVYNPDKITANDIRRQITQVGYHADDLARDSLAYENLPFCCKDGSHGTPIPQVPLKKN